MRNVAFAAAAILLLAGAASAKTYQVGPSRSFKTLNDVLAMTGPGDVVEVDGDATYEGDTQFKNAGTKASPVTIRGVRVNGKRPVLSGGEFLVNFRTDHFVFEGFDVTGASEACVFIAGDDVTIRDSVIHGCPKNGIVGSDSESGTQIFEYLEVYGNGQGESYHQMYIATDEEAHPGSVFHMEHCYVHDGLGGNNIKSRAERTEIYYNWIEGAYYHELDLIGPDTGPESLVREDTDVVGNVLVKRKDWDISRMGGDGSGRTNGRYRFVNNTIVLASDSKWVFYLQDGIDSLDLHNNVFVQTGGAKISLVKDDDAVWAQGHRIVGGSNNWVEDGFVDVPPEFTGTLRGKDPGFMDAASFDVRLKDGSPLIDAADMSPGSPAGASFPNPLFPPAYLPPPGHVEEDGKAAPRDAVGDGIDIGAFEFGDEGSGGFNPGTGAGPTGPSTTSGAGGSHHGGNGDGGGDGDASDDSGCAVSGAGASGGGVALAAALAGAALARRRRRGPARLRPARR